MKTVFLFFLFPVLLFAQKRDTIPVIMLVCDTSQHYHENLYIDYDTSYMTSFKGDPNFEVKWTYGYSIRELHNTSEGEIDPGSCPLCWHDYWLHIRFLDRFKHELSYNIIVWDYKEREL